MRNSVRRVHFVGGGGADAKSKEGAGALQARVAPAADLMPLRYGDERP